MVTYEKAKEIALEALGEFGTNINEVFETDGAYIFNDRDNIYAGRIPIVIRKSDGKALNYWRYMNQCGITLDDAKEIDF